MFEGLKKKFSNFIGSIAKKEEEKAEEVQKEEGAAEEKSSEHRAAKAESNEGVGAKVKDGVHSAGYQDEERHFKEILPEAKKEQEAKTAGKPTDIHGQYKEHRQKGDLREERKTGREEKALGAEAQAPQRPDAGVASAGAGGVRNDATIKQEAEQAAGTSSGQLVRKPGISAGTRIKGFIFREVSITDKDIEPFMEQLQVALLQSDVNYVATEKILNSIKKDLTANPLKASQLEAQISSKIRNAIFEILKKGKKADLVGMVRERKERGEVPFKILFLGPNGAGKTTTIAKMARLMLDNGLSCIISASDTFRAAAIEQSAIHAQKLGIEVLKGTYGADPASVAFDAVAHAKARGIDVVLIDSAGRQETSKSLMEEMKKMNRVIKPDLKIFVGESIAGNVLLEQLKEFDSAVGLDGVILTKLDLDAKGGNTLSIASETEIPILFICTGEGYNDIMTYDPDFIINNIIPNN